MIKKTEWFFLSTDGKTKLHTISWEPSDNPKAIIQIAHGMVEFIDRYDEFARFLAERGYMVVGNDHLAHGGSVAGKKEWGNLEPGKGRDFLVEDVHALHGLTVARYGDTLPYFLLGHSMGSFIVRSYIARYGEGLSGAIISGTSNQSIASTVAGKTLAKIISALKGPTYRSRLIDGLALGSYNKRFEPARTRVDWLTKDKTIVDAYLADPRCNFVFTVGAYGELLSLVAEVIDPITVARVPKTLPILFMSGTDDPVGGFGKGVTAAHDLFVSTGIDCVKLRLYQGDRHEILNETDRDVVYRETFEWMEGLQ